MVFGELPAAEDRIDFSQAGGRTIPHRQRDRPVQFDDGRGVGAQQRVVQAHDLGPVGRVGGGRFRVNGSDSRLQRVGAEPAGGERPFDQCDRLADLGPIPQRTVLLAEQHDLARRRGPRGVTRLVQQHQREQPDCFGLGQQLHQQSTQAYRLGSQAPAHERLARRSEIAFVEHEIDHAQHAVEAFGQFGSAWHFIGNARVADLGLGAHDALRDRRGRRQVSARDLLGRQAADLAQRQRDLRVGRQRRVTAGEDQAQPIIFDVRMLVCDLGSGNRLDLLGHVLQGDVELAAAA